MTKAFVRWLDGRTTEEDFDSEASAIEWIYATENIAGAAICERIPENGIMDDVDRSVWICIDYIRPSEDRQQPEDVEGHIDDTSSKRKRKKR